MRNIMLVLLLIPVMSWGAPTEKASPQNELLRSYQREILFLATYKKELQEKISKLDASLGKKARLAEADLQTLENKWIGLQTRNETLVEKLADLERDFESRNETKEALKGIIEQAAITYEQKFDEQVSLDEKVAKIYKLSRESLGQSAQVTQAPGVFFDPDGNQLEGEIYSLGQVAKYGFAQGQVSALYPTGGGNFRIWKSTKYQPEQLTSNKLPAQLQLFLIDDPKKEFTFAQDKTWLETIQAGGFIAWLIVLLGALALMLSLVRYWLLKQARNDNKKTLESIIVAVQTGKTTDAEEICLRKNNAVTRVVGKTLAYLRKSHESIEDVISESIIAESQIIDRFGMFILVIASVAPLLGLLGTVTGMISTFDVITQFGTGNPKLLSGGISEALITTMLGLMVAIPTLLIGQYLSGINESIKDDMEKWALAAVNNYQRDQANG